jgi:hypothetical protein
VPVATEAAPFAPTEDAANEAPLKYVSPPAAPFDAPPEPIEYVIDAPGVSERFVPFAHAPPPPPGLERVNDTAF